MCFLRKVRDTFLLLFLAIAFFCGQETNAALDERCLDEAYLKKTADRILVGEVLSVNCEGEGLSCEVSVLPKENIKGVGETGIIVETPVSREGVEVEDAPEFVIGEEARLYLKLIREPNVYNLVCGAMGKGAPEIEPEDDGFSPPSDGLGQPQAIWERLVLFLKEISRRLAGLLGFAKS